MEEAAIVRSRCTECQEVLAGDARARVQVSLSLAHKGGSMGAQHTSAVFGTVSQKTSIWVSGMLWISRKLGGSAGGSLSHLQLTVRGVERNRLEDEAGVSASRLFDLECVLTISH